MLRIAARYADQWDTFGVIPGAATEGVETDLADRIAALDAACLAIGRDPAEIRRSTWATSEALRSTDAYLDFVRHHHRLGFTDFSTVRPEASRHGRPPARGHRDHPRASGRAAARLAARRPRRLRQASRQRMPPFGPTSSRCSGVAPAGTANTSAPRTQSLALNVPSEA